MRGTILTTIFCLLLLCLILSGGEAKDEPEKRVMNYLAVMDLKCSKDIQKEQCSTLTDIALDEIVKSKKYTVIDRANRDKILGEVGFQQTGSVEGSRVVVAGRILGVGKIVVGKISKLGKIYVVSMQLINVETATVETSIKEMCKKCEIDGLITTVTNAARKLMGQPPVSTPSSTSGGLKSGEMVKVYAGDFMMGCNSRVDSLCDTDEKPYHKVYLDAFYIDKYEVTVEEYGECVHSGKCSQPRSRSDNKNCNWGYSGRGNHPINCVDWNQAKAYCEYAGKRLPTEAEWEKAARGTDGRKYPWGNEKASRNYAVMDDGCDYAVMVDGGNNSCGKVRTWPVGSKPKGASPYGAMDMAGNVYEWTADWHDSKYYSSSPNRNPTGPSSGLVRVVRGGSWFLTFSLLRSSARDYSGPGYGIYGYGVGFRCARD